MSEQLTEDPWTDEVCQDWYEMQKGRSEFIEGSMPEAVRLYLIRRIEGHYEQFADIADRYELEIDPADR